MTYEELKNRLSKCELSLEMIKNGTVNLNSKEDLTSKTKKLQILKESLTKQIKESEETMFVSTKGGDTKAVKMSTKNAIDLKSDPNITSIDTAKGKTIKERLKENNGVKFSLDETKSIAKSVGKAVAMSLKNLGDEVAHMKAKNIEENSFEIYVEYKNNSTDEFSFYITDDTLHLTDFSFDKELTEVGVKPSGEAIINVDVLANELMKHFKSMNEEEVNEAPEGMYYIKIPKDAASQNKAQVIFNDIYDIDYEINDDPNGIVMYFKKEKFNPGLLDDLEGDMVKILDTNIPMNEDAEEDAKNDADYEAGWHDDPRKDEDVDVGHKDDEPSMLGSTALETAEYAAKLYKKLQRYDNMDGEVDFPNWWQSKLILAREYMSAAYHYLDSEEKQPALDQLALEGIEDVNVNEGRGDLQTIIGIIEDRASDSGFSEAEEAQEVIEAIQDHYKLGEQKEVEENVDKVAGGIPYRQHGNKVIISEPLDDATKERLLKKAKDHGYFAQPNQAGGVTITLKGGMNERLNGDQQSALMDLQNILDRAAQLGDEARSIIKDTFPEELRGAEAYDVFNFGSSSNSYDNTLESLISDIEQRFSEDEGDDDLDEGIAKTKKAHDLVVTKMKELAKHYKAGDKSVVGQLKDLTAKKKSLEAMLDKDVAGTGVDQEIEEAGPGFAHDCAAKVVHEKYGKGNCIPEKHTLVKEGKKYVVTHYDVLFENGKTVTDIPVSELDVKTSNEHWHKGYKKKKK